MWIGLLVGAGLVVWGAIKILGPGNAVLPWLAVPLGLLIIIGALDNPFKPRRLPGENGSVIEERHYFGAARGRERREEERRR
ncbi:hypothetical protein [Phaeacidiphilus oryzae]|uniref:hypothetical protein n=1 Tax=Phaeacidiphilus oryzae TaxID=348818 RepID=UPI00056CB031|nr:hypothetical protein [Phaeacidiphilus oryzae]